MNLDFDDAFNNSVCMSVYPERYELVKKIFSYGGLPIPKYFEGSKDKGIYSTPGVHTHALVLEYAKSNDLPFIMIFEDDVYPCKNICDLLKNEYLKDIPDDADQIQLGWSKNDNSKEKKYNRMHSNVYCICASIVFKRGYDLALDCLKGRYGEAYSQADTRGTKMISYVSGKPLFIQYNTPNSKGWWGNTGYDITHDQLLSQPGYFENNFYTIDQILGEITL